jgi:hypothetical protein
MGFWKALFKPQPTPTPQQPKERPLVSLNTAAARRSHSIWLEAELAKRAPAAEHDTGYDDLQTFLADNLRIRRASDGWTYDGAVVKVHLGNMKAIETACKGSVAALQGQGSRLLGACVIVSAAGEHVLVLGAKGKPPLAFRVAGSLIRDMDSTAQVAASIAAATGLTNVELNNLGLIVLS